MSDFFLAILALNHQFTYLFIVFFLNKIIISHRSKFLFCFVFILFYDFIVDLLRRVVVSS